MNPIKYIFSVNTLRQGLISKRQITIFGIKFRFLSKKKTLNKLSQKVEELSHQENHNLINLILSQSSEARLFYIKANDVLFIFSQKILQTNSDFWRNFFLFHNNRTECHDFGVLPASSPIFKEHIKEFESSKLLCVKYRKTFGLVYQTKISYGKNPQDLYLESQYLGLENYEIDNGRQYRPVPRRKILKGITLDDYLAGKTRDQQREIWTRFFDWLFIKYASDDDTKIKGDVTDCNPGNFLVSDDKFIFIDTELTGPDVDKGLCIWYALGPDHELYKYFLDRYNAKEYPRDFTHPFWGKNIGLEKAAIKNKDLLDKYFGARAILPQET